MRGSRLVGVLWAPVAWGVPLLTTPAEAESPVAPAVWYRASAECPTGPEFLGKIADGATRARLAQAGDHIEFVVTLLAGNGETVGRLERQTNGGTVAIRELRDATCAQVADALALSLGLTLDPARSGSEAPNAQPTPASEPAAAAAPAAPLPAAPAPAPTQVTVAEAPAARSMQQTHDQPASPARRGLALGVTAGALTGLATQTMFRGSAFVDIARASSRLSWRLAFVGARGESPTPLGSVGRWLLAGRGELCPWRWGGAAWGVSPCAAFELGATSASVGEQSDHALWATPGVALRASVAVSPALNLEAAAGALLPLIRGQVFYATQPLYQDEIIAFNAELGISFGQL